MVRVLAVNNYPSRERFERLWASLAGNGAAVTSILWNEVSARMFDSYDGVALSGSPDMMSEPRIQAKYEREINAVVDS